MPYSPLPNVKLKSGVAECHFIAIPQGLFADYAMEVVGAGMVNKRPVLRAKIPNNPATSVFTADFCVVC